MSRKIVVEIVGDARKFSGTLSEASTKAEGFGARLRNVGKGMAIGAGIGAFNLLTGAISLGVSKMDEMHQAFLDDEASQARLAQTIKNTVTAYEDATKAAEDFAAAQIDLGFADEDVRDSLGQLIGVTHDIAEAQKLSQLAMDISRAKNIDLAVATDAVTKAYNGQGRSLAALGIDIRGAVGSTQLLDRALKNVKGSAAAYATTGAGRVARANARMGETMEKVGKAIDVVSQIAIPIMLEGLAELVDIVGDAIGVLASLANTVGSTLANAFATAANAARPLADVVDVIADAIGTVQGALGGGGTTAGAGGVVTRDLGGGVTSRTYPGGFGGSFHTGGTVPGVPGSESLVRLQAGETVIPANKTGGATIYVNIESFIGSDRDIDRFSDRLAFRLRSTALS